MVVIGHVPVKKILAVTGMLIFFYASCFAVEATAGVDAQDGVAIRPNILLLVAEDLSPRVGSFGDTVAETPNIDQLAAQGTRYTNVFTTAGVCAPSRAALITGQHQTRMAHHHIYLSPKQRSH